MTRRIAIAILVVTYSALMVIGVGIYLATRLTLLSDLDDSIVARATALPSGLGVAATGNSSGVPEGDRYIIRNAIGQTLARPTTSTAAFKPVIKSKAFTTLGDGTRLRTITLVLGADPTQPNSASSTTITYSTSVERFDRLLNQLVIWLATIGAAAGLCATGAAVVLSRLALRPLRQTAKVIGDIDERNLDRRIEVSALPPELAPMASRLNEMLTRLEGAFDQRTRFLADASHELRTPVAGLMTTIEVALRLPRDSGALREVLESCLTDVKLLRHLVDRLMQQVRSESAILAEANETFDLVALINQCIDAVDRSRQDKVLHIQRELPPTLVLHTQPNRIRGILTNLLSNALEYTPSRGIIEVRCSVSDEELLITVLDSGPGIDRDFLPRLFTPFSRGDRRRAAEGGHLGLGLSIVQSHARALGGICTLESNPGNGAKFCIHLPTSLMVPIPEETAVVA